MNENDVLFQKVTQAYSETKIRTSSRKVLGSTPDRSTFPSMPVSLSGIIHHSQIYRVAKNGYDILRVGVGVVLHNGKMFLSLNLCLMRRNWNY